MRYGMAQRTRVGSLERNDWSRIPASWDGRMAASSSWSIGMIMTEAWDFCLNSQWNGHLKSKWMQR